MSKIEFKRLRLDEWPAQDRKLWLKSRERHDMFDEQGFAADWRPATVTGVEKGYGTYVAWLAQANALLPDETPMSRATKPRIDAFLNAYSPGRAEATIASTIRHVAYMVRACHPPHGHEWLTQMAHRMTNLATPSRPKAPRMATLTELLDLGNRLMDEGKKLLTKGQSQGAWLFRDGLLISMLIAHPLRRRNIAAMKLEKTVLIDEGGVHVHFAGHETKTRNSISFSYPAWLTEPFVFYLEHVRPRLLEKSSGDDNGHIWIGRRGRPMPENDITQATGRRTVEYLGRRVSPHLFRDCVATGIATLDPKHVGITSTVLDHANLASSQKYYNQATGFGALNRYQSVLGKIRQKGHP
ncbi:MULTISPECIES: hypothetical protein [Asticcacaulis]|uniref:hypothetical protein n=1 Tax=Asticcacaulis TaxID=76890 RepID=UPI001AE721B0|nr:MULTISPECIES: hypothetical protein [Asticcacaulis]MBP2157493.1 integrase/recombinase XerC [Asticcacaulis solisilvae]MDR6798538.1 integrase/recombinase XerC [Asticcacaulis sp. BE141]